MNDKNFYPDSEETPFLPERVLAAIDGHLSLLQGAFPWDLTPQGHDYWATVCFMGQGPRGIDLSDKDKIQLLRWCANYWVDLEQERFGA